MAARRYEISLRVLKNISQVSENISQVFTQKLLLVFHWCLYNKIMFTLYLL